jgi:hypothetical protein
VAKPKRYVMGVDPGFTGALALAEIETKRCLAFDMPVMKNSRGQTVIDLAALTLLVESYAGQTAVAIVEEVGARPGDGRSSLFKFGYGAGILAGVLAAYSVPAFPVRPEVWKCLMGVSADKASSIRKASSLYPLDAYKFLSRKKDHGRAEAILLAHFGVERGLWKKT